jgi:muconolactone delta-isomerase
MPEFIVEFEITPPFGLAIAAFEELLAQEAQAAKPYLDNGTFARVWRIPGQRSHIALWNAPDADYVHRAYASFPLFKLNIGRATVLPLAVNPNDPGTPAADRPDLKMTWACLNDYYNAQEGHQPGEAGAARHESKTVMLTDTVSIHKHTDGPEPEELHFMVSDVKVAELGPDRNTRGEMKAPGYVDLLAKWAGAPVEWQQWKTRIEQDNGVLHPSYEDALAAPRHSNKLHEEDSRCQVNETAAEQGVRFPHSHGPHTVG